ncbi:NUDIX hydrolase domain-like protein [Lactarius sanguifluus]|nr:NUDIX hydrolase domain-like protein [Lactarius sanguifluus]
MKRALRGHYIRLLQTMATAPSRAKDVSGPRPSASLVVLNDRNEVLLVHRNPNATAFAGMHDFPGGNYDEIQDESYQMTAIRETFEETGLLLATSPSGSPPSDAVLDASRESINTRKTLFGDFLRRHALVADVKALLPFTEWVTPLGAPRRFHTRFYVAFLPALRASGFSSGVAQHRLPTSDGGQEVIEARFVHPRDALAEHGAKQIALMPPQHYILSTIADILVGPEARTHQRERVERLSVGAFGRMVVHPRAGKKDASGRTPLVFEGDETRGGPKGRLHRSLVLFSPETKAQLPTEVTLLRNFDIFTEVESGVASKL